MKYPENFPKSSAVTVVSCIIASALPKAAPPVNSNIAPNTKPTKPIINEITLKVFKDCWSLVLSINIEPPLFTKLL